MIGKSMEIIPQGTIHLKLGEEHYQWYVTRYVTACVCLTD